MITCVDSPWRVFGAWEVNLETLVEQPHPERLATWLLADLGTKVSAASPPEAAARAFADLDSESGPLDDDQQEAAVWLPDEKRFELYSISRVIERSYHAFPARDFD